MPYAVPYFVFVGIVTVGDRFFSDIIIYVLELVFVPLSLVWAWKWIMPLVGPKNAWVSAAWGIFAGSVGLVLWCLMLVPFTDIKGSVPEDMTAFVLRAIAAALLVPVFEELFIRGFILRLAYQWDLNRKHPGVKAPFSKAMDEDNIHNVSPGAWTPAAVLISTVAFSAGHLMYEWPACLVYSVLMSFLWIVRKDMISCIVAHGVTNFGLAVYVYLSGNWGFW